jgi:hypothetical protein
MQRRSQSVTLHPPSDTGSDTGTGVDSSQSPKARDALRKLAKCNCGPWRAKAAPECSSAGLPVTPRARDADWSPPPPPPAR